MSITDLYSLDTPANRTGLAAKAKEMIESGQVDLQSLAFFLSCDLPAQEEVVSEYAKEWLDLAKLIAGGQHVTLPETPTPVEIARYQLSANYADGTTFPLDSSFVMGEESTVRRYDLLRPMDLVNIFWCCGKGGKKGGLGHLALGMEEILQYCLTCERTPEGHIPPTLFLLNSMESLRLTAKKIGKRNDCFPYLIAEASHPNDAMVQTPWRDPHPELRLPEVQGVGGRIALTFFRPSDVSLTKLAEPKIRGKETLRKIVLSVNPYRH